MSTDRLARLEAADSIRRTISLYCDAVARKDPDAIAELFTPDAQVKIADGNERIGRDEIVEGLRRTAEGFEFLHQKCDTGLIEVEGDTARARLGVVEINQPIGADSLNFIFGIYEDKLRLLEGRWRFCRRKFTLQYIASLPAASIRKFADFEPALPFLL